jgi:exonuclease III
MKLICINIPPLNRVRDIKLPDDDVRAVGVRKYIKNANPDVVFFTEESASIYNDVSKQLDKEYRFYYPHEYRPDNGNYAGVVAAVRSYWPVTPMGGEGYVELTGRWLALEIGSAYYLAVHYPLRKKIAGWDIFHEAVKTFASEKKPALIVGDFNIPIGRSPLKISGYRDLLDSKTPTFHKGTKTDCAFVRDDIKAVFGCSDDSVRKLDDRYFFSDHSAIIVEF